MSTLFVRLIPTLKGYFYHVMMRDLESKEHCLVQSPMPLKTAEAARDAAQRHVAIFAEHIPGGELTTAQVKSLEDLKFEAVFTDVQFNEPTLKQGYTVELYAHHQGRVLQRVGPSAHLRLDQVHEAYEAGVQMLAEALKVFLAPGVEFPEGWAPEIGMSASKELVAALPSLFGEDMGSNPG